MIDRAARDQLASLVRRFAIGSITNREFEAAMPSSQDAAIGQIEHQVWFFYDDFQTQRLTGRMALSYGLRRDFARMVLFLKSDQEFLWPWPTFNMKRLAARLICALTVGLCRPSFGNRPAVGDLRVWPFLSKNDYHRALKDRHYLSGVVHA